MSGLGGAGEGADAARQEAKSAFNKTKRVKPKLWDTNPMLLRRAMLVTLAT